MFSSSFTVSTVDLAYSETMLPLNITQRVTDAKIITLRNFMQSIGYFERLKEISLEAIFRAIGEKKAEKVGVVEFEEIHNIINLDELSLVIEARYHAFHEISPDLARKIDSFFNRFKEIRYIISPSEVDKFNDLSEDFSILLSVQTLKEEIDAGSLPFDVFQLKAGTIRPLSQKLCVARLYQERIVIFSRYCPHEGADLAAGSLKGNCVLCSWHNLPLNLNDGVSSCQSLPQLTILKSNDREVQHELSLEMDKHNF